MIAGQNFQSHSAEQSFPHLNDDLREPSIEQHQKFPKNQLQYQTAKKFNNFNSEKPNNSAIIENNNNLQIQDSSQQKLQQKQYLYQKQNAQQFNNLNFSHHQTEKLDQNHLNNNSNESMLN